MIDEMAEKLQREHGIEEFADITSSNQVINLSNVTSSLSSSSSLLLFVFINLFMIKKMLK